MKLSRLLCLKSGMPLKTHPSAEFRKISAASFLNFEQRGSKR